MSAIEHIRAAENLLGREHPADEPSPDELVARAQVHATLALAHLEYERTFTELPESTNDNEEAPTQ